MAEAKDMLEGKDHEKPGLAPATHKRRTPLEVAEEKAERAQHQVKVVKAKAAAKSAHKVLHECYQQALQDQDPKAAHQALQDFIDTWETLIELQLPDEVADIPLQPSISRTGEEYDEQE